MEHVHSAGSDLLKDVSVQTRTTAIRRILAKLGVKDRLEAVQRGGALGLLGDP